MEPTRETVSKTLNMSVSTLQRQLRSEQRTFHGILLQVRKDLADNFLIDQHVSSTEVAFLLGYQSSS